MTRSTNILLVFCIIMLTAMSLPAQKPTKKTTPKRPAVEYVELANRSLITVRLDSAGRAATSIQTIDGKELSVQDSIDLFADLAKLGNARLSPLQKRAQAPAVLVIPEGSLKYSVLKDAVRAYRDPSNLRTMVRLDNDITLFVPEKPLPMLMRPNLLNLVLSLKDGKLYLNNERRGTLSEHGDMVNWLKEIFKFRAENGAWRVGTNEVEATVHLKAEAGDTVADLTKLATVARDGGSDNLGLYVDEVEILIDTIKESPRRNK